MEGWNYIAPMGTKRAIGRVVISLAGGVILFLAITICTGVLSTYTNNRFLRLLLEMPTRWPRYAYYYLSPAYSKPNLFFDDSASLIALLACNVALYSLIVFFGLWLLSIFRKSKDKYEPPPPPDEKFADKA